MVVVSLDRENIKTAAKFSDVQKISVSPARRMKASGRPGAPGGVARRSGPGGTSIIEALQTRKGAGLTAAGAFRAPSSKSAARISRSASEASGGGRKFGSSPSSSSSPSDFSSFFAGESADDDFIAQLSPKTTTISAGALRGFNFNPRGGKYGDQAAKKEAKKEVRKQKTVNKHVERKRRSRGGGGIVKSGGKMAYPGESNPSRRPTNTNQKPSSTDDSASTTAGRSLMAQAGIKLSPRNQMLASALGAVSENQGIGLSLQQVKSAAGNRGGTTSRVSDARAMNGAPSVSLSTTRTVEE
ncbi:MAG TPA: hypothetical protein EYG51_21535 [Pseudomonadales bacterium]|nr:hypothetical protein [Pseudomonadales bacterium]